MENPDDSALRFWQTVVEPTVSEFLARPDDLRRGVLACLVLASMADHYFHGRPAEVRGPSKPDGFRAFLCKRNWAFKQVVDVSNATKHVLPKEDRIGFEDIGVQNIHIGNMRCDWPINGRETMVEAGPDNVWLLRHLAEAVVTMWREQLKPAQASDN